MAYTYLINLFQKGFGETFLSPLIIIEIEPKIKRLNARYIL